MAQQAYNAELRNQVAQTGNIYVFPEVDIPGSIRRTWRSRGPREYVSLASLRVPTALAQGKVLRAIRATTRVIWINRAVSTMGDLHGSLLRVASGRRGLRASGRAELPEDETDADAVRGDLRASDDQVSDHCRARVDPSSRTEVELSTEVDGRRASAEFPGAIVNGPRRIHGRCACGNGRCGKGDHALTVSSPWVHHRIASTRRSLPQKSSPLVTNVGAPKMPSSAACAV